MVTCSMSSQIVLLIIPMPILFVLQLTVERMVSISASGPPLVPFTVVSFRAAQFDAGTVAGVQWLLMVVFV